MSVPDIRAKATAFHGAVLHAARFGHKGAYAHPNFLIELRGLRPDAYHVAEGRGFNKQLAKAWNAFVSGVLGATAQGIADNGHVNGWVSDYTRGTAGNCAAAVEEALRRAPDMDVDVPADAGALAQSMIRAFRALQACNGNDDTGSRAEYQDALVASTGSL